MTTSAINFDSERLQMLLHALPIGISWARLEDSRIIFVNHKFTEIFGYTAEDFATVPEWVEKTYVREDHRKRAASNWYKFFEMQTTDQFEIDPVEVDVLCKSGEIKTTIHGGVILPETDWALATFTDISDRKRDEDLIRRLAEEDSLTKLKNRRAFEAHLERVVDTVLREGRSMHLLILDLDYFKQINDTYGHQIGDKVLMEVASRLRQCVRSSDVLARFAGDEFAIILNDAGGRDNVDQVCHKIMGCFMEPFDCEGDEEKLGVSIGIACLPGDARDTTGLFWAADKAMYASKGTGRNTWTYASQTD